MVADNLRIDGMTVSFSLIFEKPTDPFMKSMVKAAEQLFIRMSPDVRVTNHSREASSSSGGGQDASSGKEYYWYLFR